MSRLAASALCAALVSWPGTPARAQEARAEGARAQDLRAQGASGPSWTLGATCYEIFVRSFFDSDDDGIGDLKGLIAKLDYVNDGDPASQRDLGARCIWLMPVNPSPSYHGYDVTDYYRVNPQFGTNQDFKRFVAEAHKRGVRVIVDMVLNHTSSEHPWFKHAALHRDSPWRDWYTWLPKDPGIKNEWGGTNWHRSPSSEDYYYGFFWHGMPDLNVQNPGVIAETKKIATFWLDSMGVDGFRLDANRHLVEGDTGRLTTNQPGTHVFLRDYAAHVRGAKPDAYTVGEVMDSSRAMLAYYPDQLDSHFAFEVADSILSAANHGRAQGLLAPILRLQRELPAWRYSPFLRNHDQTRTMTVLGGDVQKAKLAVTILLTLPGVPFVYYGEEIGMTGDKPDPRLRTPMHWSRGPAAGFTQGLPWEPLQPDSLTANVEVLEGDSLSLLNLHRRLIHLRASSAALGAGELVALETSHPAVAAWVRRDEKRPVLVVANLGAAPLTGVLVSSAGRLLAPGRYAVTDLLARTGAARMTVAADGRVRGYSPRGELRGRTAYVLELDGDR